MTDIAVPQETAEGVRGGGKGLSVTALVVLLLGLPIFLFGLATTFSFIKLMNSPTLNGQVPVWVLLVLAVLVLLILKRKQTNPYWV